MLHVTRKINYYVLRPVRVKAVSQYDIGASFCFVSSTLHDCVHNVALCTMYVRTEPKITILD